MGEVPRHDLKPSQYLLQLKDDVKDVSVDHILREHVLKSIPPRIRELLGKQVEEKSAEEVAKLADAYFDRSGKPIEKHSNPINNVNVSSSSTAPPSASSSSTPASPFTPLFSDDDTDVNQVKRGNFQGRGRSRSRGGQGQGRSNANRFPNASSGGNSGNNNSSGDSKQNAQPRLCRWHKKFGEKAYNCDTTCSKFKSFNPNQRPGNDQGGRRM